MKKLQKIISAILVCIICVTYTSYNNTFINVYADDSSTARYECIGTFEGYAYTAATKYSRAHHYWSKSSGFNKGIHNWLMSEGWDRDNPANYGPCYNFGDTTEREVPLFDRIYANKGDHFRFKVVGTSCSHSPSGCDIYITNNEGEKTLVGQLRTPLAFNGVKTTVQYDYEVPESGFYDASGIGWAYACSESAGHGVSISSVYEKYRYIEEDYLIQYDGNGHDSGATMCQEKREGTDILLSRNSFVKDGFAFKEWNTEPDGSGKAYRAGSTYKDNASITLYAQWIEANEGDCNVFAEIGSEYKVTIPKVIVLKGQKDTSIEYNVTVEGDIAGQEIISVIPDESVALSADNKDDVIGTIAQNKTKWTYDDLGNVGKGVLSVNGLSAGKWSGNMNFNISVENFEDNKNSVEDVEYQNIEMQF